MNKATPLSQVKNTLTLDLEGMTCAACAARIERVISKNESIDSVSVNFPLKKAVIKYQQNINIDELIQKISSIGYSADISTPKEEVKVSYKNTFLIPFISLVLSAGISRGFNTDNSTISYFLGFIVIFIFGRRFHISALKKIKQKSDIIIYTDSKYVKDGITEWIKKWKINNWKSSNKKPVKNKDLWTKLDSLCQKHKVNWKWVKAHAGNEMNNLADELAVLETK